MAIYKFLDEVPTYLICNHVKEALHIIKLDEDYFRAGLHIQMARNLAERTLPKGFGEKLPDNYQMDDPDNLGFGYYDGDPPYALIRLKK